MRNYTEGVYKRKRNGKIVFDGVLAYYDETGKRKFAHRERNKESLAREAIRQLRKDLEKRGPKAVKNKVVTFAHLADYCETEIYVQAEHNEAGDKTNSGVQKPSTYKSHIKHFRQFFAGRKLKDLSVADLKRYRSHRLRSTRRGPNNTEVNIKPATAARELNTLRAMLNEAVRNKWLDENPFAFARKNEVIKASDRKKRNLFLTFNQEIKLLRACQTEDRRHLRALIIVAVDTGARFGELIKLKKAQIDFTGSGTIYGLLNYKDLGGDKQTRNAKMTPRVREALLDVMRNPPSKTFKVQRGKKPPADLVFGITSNVRTAWAGALKDAGLTHLGLHFHDLRHTPGTRVKKMIDLVDIANALGHKDPKTTAQIYINHTDEDLIEFARAVAKAVETGYKEAMSEDVKPDLESGLIS